MQFRFTTAVLAALLAIVVAQDDVEKKDDGYQLNPKFPEYAKLSTPSLPEAPTTPEVPEVPEHKAPVAPKDEKPAVPELPKLEKPELPKYEKPEIPEYKKPEYPEFEKPEFPEYKKPEFPEFEKPEFPEYEKPEFPEYQTPEAPTYEEPELPKYEQPEFPEYEKPEVPMSYEHPEAPEAEYHAPAYPSYHGYPEHVNFYPARYYHYYGHPDFSADQPQEMDMMDSGDDSDMTEEDKKAGDYTPHDSKMDKDQEEEKKEEDAAPMESKMADEDKKEDNYGFPVFNFHEFELPKIEEHNFDDFKYNLTNDEDKNSTDADYFKAQADQQVPVAKTYQQVYHPGYFPNEYPVPSTYAPGAKVEYNHPAPGHGYQPRQPQPHPMEYPEHGKPNYNVPHPAEYQKYPAEYHQYPAEYQKYPAYQPNAGAHEYTNTVEGEASYYRLDTCEYRFILDMVQCHQEERHSEKVNVHSTGQGHQYQGQGPYYNNYNTPSGPYGNQNGYPSQAPYDSRYYDFMRLYGNPMYYVDHVNGHSYKPGHFDDSLFSYRPAVGHPFYAPGMHNTPFAKYYAGFQAGKHEQGHEAETRQYHKEGHYQTALQDFHNLKLQNVVKVDTESQSSIKTSSKVSVSDEAGYAGVTPSFNYRVQLLPNHCAVPGYDGRHTCIVFSGATYPYRMVHRQFIYLKNTREVQGKYRFRYENGQRVQY